MTTIFEPSCFWFFQIDAVARENFLGPGPWHILRWGGGYRATPDADPIYLYTDDVIGIRPERHLNNGNSMTITDAVATFPQSGEFAVIVDSEIMWETQGAGGGTPLIDAAYKTVKAVENAIVRDKINPKVVICILTDGHENQSVEHTWEEPTASIRKPGSPTCFKALIESRIAEGWQFNFMGAARLAARARRFR
jgi:hypothetical protein